MTLRSERIRKNSIWNTNTPSLPARELPVYGLEAGHFYTEPEYLVERDYHNSFLLLCTVAGTGTVKTEGNVIELLEHSAVIIDCRVKHSYAPKGDKWEFLWLHFAGTNSESLVKMLYPEAPCRIVPAEPLEFEKDFLKVVEGLLENDTVSAFDSSLRIQKLILKLLAARTAAYSGNVRLPDRIMDEAVPFIEEHFMENIAVSDIAAALNMSEYYFIRQFKKVMGVPPYNYLTAYRVTRAKRLLAETDMTVERISEQCGFNDTANFISKFRKLAGETPLKYRKAFRQT